MRLWTTQRRKTERAQKIIEGVEVYDITYTQGDKLFAPDIKCVMDYKQGRMSWGRFTDLYVELMNRRFREMPEYYIQFCQKEKVTVCCFCNSKVYCHRHLLVKLLREFCDEHNIKFSFGGEIF